MRINIHLEPKRVLKSCEKFAYIHSKRIGILFFNQTIANRTMYRLNIGYPINGPILIP